jgi:predicted transport protein
VELTLPGKTLAGAENAKDDAVEPGLARDVDLVGRWGVGVCIEDGNFIVVPGVLGEPCV